MTNKDAYYPIGSPGKAWGKSEKTTWLEAQKKRRCYFNDVVSTLEQLDAKEYEVIQYGELGYADLGFSNYPLFCVKVGQFRKDRPTILVTGGVHGYETSGVHGALSFIKDAAKKYTDTVNVLVLPCISPWGYETINRWNPFAIDPNRSFYPEGPTDEANLAMQCVKQLSLNIMMHIDLHETTDTDNSEFRPALAARDGIEHDNWDIPDGFYTVADSTRPESAFQKAIISAVQHVTHIAEPDSDGKIIGADVSQQGVIHYDKRSLSLCGGFSDAKYVSTTEVYPDSANATPEICIKAQVAAITGGLQHVIDNLA